MLIIISILGVVSMVVVLFAALKAASDADDRMEEWRKNHYTSEEEE